MRIVVVCGAGASSTFVAQRVRRTIDAQGLAHTVSAVPASALPGCLEQADVLLVGPHLADRLDGLRADAATRGVRIAVLPADIFGDRDGDRALALATAATAARPAAAARGEEHA